MHCIICYLISWSSKLSIYNKKIHRDWKQCCGLALVSDFSADPAFYVNANSDPDPDLIYRHIKILVEDKIIVSLLKTYIVNIPRPPWRTQLQGETLPDLRREHSKLLQQCISSLFLFLWVNFAHLEPDPHSQCGSWSRRPNSWHIHADLDPHHCLKRLLLTWPEPVLLNVYGALELIPRNEFRQPM